MAGSHKKDGSAGPLAVLVLIAVAAIAVWIYRDLWPWFAAGGCVMAVFCLWLVIRRLRVATSMVRVDRMSGAEFERYLVKLFKRRGFRVSHVGSGGGDFGADLVVEKDGRKIAVQAKHRESSRVGNDAVQQAVAGASYYDCGEAAVVTNSGFTKAAKQQASGSNIKVHLWGRKALEKLFRGRRL